MAPSHGSEEDEARLLDVQHELEATLDARDTLAQKLVEVQQQADRLQQVMEKRGGDDMLARAVYRALINLVRRCESAGGMLDWPELQDAKLAIDGKAVAGAIEHRRRFSD